MNLHFREKAVKHKFIVPIFFHIRLRKPDAHIMFFRKIKEKRFIIKKLWQIPIPLLIILVESSPELYKFLLFLTIVNIYDAYVRYLLFPLLLSS